MVSCDFVATFRVGTGLSKILILLITLNPAFILNSCLWFWICELIYCFWSRINWLGFIILYLILSILIKRSQSNLVLVILRILAFVVLPQDWLIVTLHGRVQSCGEDSTFVRIISSCWGFAFWCSITFKFQSCSWKKITNICWRRSCVWFCGSSRVENAQSVACGSVDELACILPGNALLLEVLLDDIQGLLVYIETQ